MRVIALTTASTLALVGVAGDPVAAAAAPAPILAGTITYLGHSYQDTGAGYAITIDYNLKQTLSGDDHGDATVEGTYSRVTDYYDGSGTITCSIHLNYADWRPVENVEADLTDTIPYQVDLPGPALDPIRVTGNDCSGPIDSSEVGTATAYLYTCQNNPGPPGIGTFGFVTVADPSHPSGSCTYSDTESFYSISTTINFDLHPVDAPEPTPTPTPTPSSTPTTTPSPAPSATSTPSPTVTVTPTPSAAPTPTPSASPAPTPSASPAPTPTASPTATTPVCAAIAARPFSTTGVTGTKLTAQLPAATPSNGAEIRTYNLLTESFGTAGWAFTWDKAGGWSMIPAGPGPVNFTYSVTDSAGCTSAPATVSVTANAAPVVNHAPVAANYNVAVKPGTAVRVNVLSNDTDVDPGDQAQLRVSKWTQPAHGGVTCATQPGGHCIYTPNSTFSDTDSFTYTVGDPEGATASGVVTLANPNPTHESVPDCINHPDQNPVYCYAPEVRLDSSESAFPMGTDEFISHAALKWAHDQGCSDDTIPNAGLGKVDAAKLRSGEYKDRQNKPGKYLGIISCHAYGPEYNSAQLTRPSNTDADGNPSKAAGLALNEGFFLDLDNKWRSGDPRANNGATVTAPLDYSYGPGKFITYWFMYGFNPGAPGGAVGVGNTGVGVDRHEGEWEGITVMLNATNRATSVRFAQHTCGAEEVSWSKMTDANSNNGSVVDATHPIVYAAEGSHASYPAKIKIPLVPGQLCTKKKKDYLQGVGDYAFGDGATWDTWNVQLTNVVNEPWYGYGGAWGEVGSIGNPATNTGPLGPPWKPAVFTVYREE